MLLSIDPGSTESAYCVTDDDLKPIEFGKILNDELADKINNQDFINCEHIAIEHIQCLGMAVGKEVFETCYFIGRITEMFQPATIMPIYRKEEKMAICGSMKAKDTNIRQALIDKFAKHDFKNGKGTKKEPDFFYGFRADVWSAFSVAYTAKMKLEGEK